MLLDGIGRVHLIGIGGIGVSAVARLLLGRGVSVSGSDVRESSLTRALRSEGAQVVIGHSPENLRGADLVVFSTAIPDTNPELVAARRMGLRVVHRSEVLGALLHGRRSIGVTGTNGKGTVSALVTHLLAAGGLEPGFAIGGIIPGLGTNASVGSGGLIVAEVDESDGSLLNVRPEIAVINNLEADHLNYYKDLDAVIDTAVRFVSGNAALKLLVASADCAGCGRVLAATRIPRVTFGLGAGDFRAVAIRCEGMCSRFSLLRKGADEGEFSLCVPGAYNVSNALAAIATADACGVGVETMREALPRFRGLENRFTMVQAGPVTVVKDFISHPTGIARVLEAARSFNPRQVIAVFKPYRFTMIHYLQDEYTEAFRGADLTLVTELYTAGEVPIPGVDAEWLVGKIRASGSRTEYVHDMAGIIPALLQAARPGDQIVFFGGDDLFALADRFVAEARVRWT